MSNENKYTCRRCLRPSESDAIPIDRICEACAATRDAIVPPLDIERVFGPDGPLAKAARSAGGRPYEARPGQVALARAILDATSKKKHVLAEGPCGIGKSKAYGVPASWLAAHGKKVLIVTASIALQEQLVSKDLPDLARELPWKFDFAILKGKTNYLCVEEAEEAEPSGLDPSDISSYRDVAQWARLTKKGDRSELAFTPPDYIWSRFSTTSDACPGKKCPSYDRCFAKKARDDAANAGIIVTNYHLFFLNMVCGGTILPAADVVILDEAHEAADIARELLGFKISYHAFNRVAKAADKKDASIGREIRVAAQEFLSKLLRFSKTEHYKTLLRWPLPISTERVEAAMQSFVNHYPTHHLADYAGTVGRRLREGATVANPNIVYSIETKVSRGGEESATMAAQYVNVGPVLRQLLWGAYGSVAAVSATLTTDASFAFVREELGAPDDAHELAVESPFAFERQAMFVQPSKDFPEPNDPGFVDAAARATIDVIEACGGRTLALFTSYKQLNAVHERVCRHFAGTGIRIMKQGEAPTGRLAEAFKADSRSVLLGTSSFWTGIDVPGDALTGLVIDRLPFGSPDDPVTVRMNERGDGGNTFARFTTPKAILTFRQGVGRLIRSQSDVGAIVCLDRRLTTKGYGARFMRSIPRMARATSTKQIAPFLRSRGVVA